MGVIKGSSLLIQLNRRDRKYENCHVHFGTYPIREALKKKKRKKISRFDPTPPPTMKKKTLVKIF